MFSFKLKQQTSYYRFKQQLQCSFFDSIAHMRLSESASVLILMCIKYLLMNAFQMKDTVTQTQTDACQNNLLYFKQA